MAGPIVGQVEMVQATSQGTGSAQSLFVNLYRFLDGPCATKLGVQRRAYYTGSAVTGAPNLRAMNMYNESGPAGDQAWATFFFSSASKPFDVWLAWGNNNTWAGNASPTLFANNNSTGGAPALCIAFAQSTSLTSSWNGSTNNNGNDTKGTPVWQTGSFYVPRSNDGIRGGAHATNRQNCNGLQVANNTSYRAHFIADYDNLVLVYDSGADNSYGLIAFCQYTPMSGVSPTLPYFGVINNAIPNVVGTTYGSTAGATTQTDGGVAHTNFAQSGTCGWGTDRLGTNFFQNASAQPNLATSPAMWNEFDTIVGSQETGLVGMLGQCSFLREAYNIATHDTNADGSRAVFGTTVVASVKNTTPFHTGTSPGSGVTLGGISFSVP